MVFEVGKVSPGRGDRNWTLGGRIGVPQADREGLGRGSIWAKGGYKLMLCLETVSVNQCRARPELQSGNGVTDGGMVRQDPEGLCERGRAQRGGRHSPCRGVRAIQAAPPTLPVCPETPLRGKGTGSKGGVVGRVERKSIDGRDLRHSKINTQRN